MDLSRLKLGAMGAACAVVVGMGAIEFGPPPVVLRDPELPGSCPWDYGNFDSNVGIVDFLELLGDWKGKLDTHCSGSPPPEDGTRTILDRHFAVRLARIRGEVQRFRIAPAKPHACYWIGSGGRGRLLV